MFNINDKKKYKSFEVNFISKEIFIVGKYGWFLCSFRFNDDEAFNESVEYWQSKLPLHDAVYPDGTHLRDIKKQKLKSAKAS